jgi:hypothetical protein
MRVGWVDWARESSLNGKRVIANGWFNGQLVVGVLEQGGMA